MLKRIFAAIIPLFILFSIAACGVGAPSAPSIERIKGDLLGKRIGVPLLGPTWTFDSVSEYEEFKILDTKKAENTIEYKAEVKLKEGSGNRFTATLNIVYRLESGEWKMVNLTDNNTFKRI